MLETDIWFKAYYANIENSVFEKKYVYVEYYKLRILLEVEVLNLKNTKFINTQSMCDICIRVNECKKETNIEDCSFMNSGRIYIASCDDILVKNSIIRGVVLNLIMMNDKNGYTASRQILFENCDFANGSSFFPQLYVDNGIAESSFIGPFAIKFEYDLNNLPNVLKSRISGTPTAQKIAEVLKPFITGCKERVGYFINLGNRNPSNSSPAKFLGNYY